MNKRYMDFVPVKKTEGAKASEEVTKKAATKKTMPSKPASVKTAPVRSASTKSVSAERSKSLNAARPTANFTREVRPFAGRTEPEVDVTEIMQERKRAGVTRPSVRLGVVEDYKPRFLNTEVKKRPLSASKEKAAPAMTQEQKDALIEAKQKKIAATNGILESALLKAEEIGTTRKNAREMRKEAKKEAKLSKIPKTPFVNTEKISKRPLSKNVYTKKVVAPKEEPQGPVTIIEKPEKDSRMGMVVAIILTIILGAAAGTVAFLLLPK